MMTLKRPSGMEFLTALQAFTKLQLQTLVFSLYACTMDRCIALDVKCILGCIPITLLNTKKRGTNEFKQEIHIYSLCE